MKSMFALVIVAVTAWIGFNLSDPVFDEAAWNLCSAHAEEHGLELVEASGRLGYRRGRNWLTPRSPSYWCTFEDSTGTTILLDELDRVMDVTWESRGLRFAGWGLIVAPIVGGMAIAGATGLLKRE